MSTILTDIGLVVTAALGWVGEVVTVIVASPLLLLFASIGLVGLGVGLFKRIVN